jgi:tRNA-guanine family transglycosylase
MKPAGKELVTRRGTIKLPAYFPVTTFGHKYPLDGLLRPYLPRLAPGVMVSYHYARLMQEPPRLPLLLDSGGFASLLEGGSVVADGDLGVLEFRRDTRTERTHPRELLELQEQVAEVGFTLDFPVPPGMGEAEARGLQRRTIANALWAAANRRRKDLLLFACVQGWDAASARECARAYRGCGFDGIAIGGLVPRARDMNLVRSIVDGVRAEVGQLPLHVFGLGNPDTVEALLAAGVDSVDSSSYVKLAVQGRLWGAPGQLVPDPSPVDRMQLALCNLAVATGKTLPLPMIASLFERYGCVTPDPSRR